MDELIKTVIPWGVPPLKHQQEALDKFGGREYYALFGEMGTGKTWIALADIFKLHIERKINRALVAVPSGMQPTWLHAIESFKPSGIEVFAQEYGGDNRKKIARSKWRQSFEARLRVPDDEELRILVINHESFSCAGGLDILERFLVPRHRDKTVLVVDESDAFKAKARGPHKRNGNVRPNRSFNLLKFRECASFRRIMTGTPIADRPFDLYTPLSFLSPSILEEKTYQSYISSITYPTRNRSLVNAIMRKNPYSGIPYIPQKNEDNEIIYRNLDDVMARIKPHAHRITKEECLSLPEKIYRKEYYHLSLKCRQQYDFLRKELSLDWNGDMMDYDALTVVTKLSQVVGGFILSKDGDPIVLDKAPNKLELCISSVKYALTGGESVIVWCRYRHEVWQIVEKLIDSDVPNCFCITGETSQAERRDIIDHFTGRKNTVLVTTPASCGAGYNFQNASVMVYYNNTWALRDRQQSEDRAHRIGQKSKVTVIDLVCEGTIDEDIVKAVYNKNKVSREMMALL